MERASAREDFKGNLPLILLLFGDRSGAGLARPLADGTRLGDLRCTIARSTRWHLIWALFASLGQVVLPTDRVHPDRAGDPADLDAGADRAAAGRRCLPAVGFAIFASVWLGGRVFPKVETGPTCR